MTILKITNLCYVSSIYVCMYTNLDDAIVEKISDPRDCCVSMFVV